jgi:hypothetical protein
VGLVKKTGGREEEKGTGKKKQRPFTTPSFLRQDDRLVAPPTPLTQH